MEITPLMLYVVTTLDSVGKALSGFSFFTCILSIIAIVVFFCVRAFEEKEYYETTKKGLIWSCSLFFVFTMINAFIPSTKSAAIIFGVPYMMGTLKETGVDKIPPKMVEYAELYIDKELLQMRKDIDQEKEKMKK